MAEDVNVPVAGHMNKKALLIGGAVLAGILGYAYWRHSQNAKAAAGAADTSTDPNAIDPATGLTYGEEAAGIQSGTLAGGGTGFGDTSGLVGYDAQGNPIYSDAVGYGPTPSFVNNGAWSQAAEQYLVSTTGADAGTVAAALGAYLNGQTLTSAQASIVQQAIGFFGQPPSQGSNGYPPALRLQAPSGSGTPAPPPAPTPTPTPGPSGPPPGPHDVHATVISKHAFKVAWSPVHGAVKYIGHLTYQGKNVGGSQTTTGTSMTFSGLQDNRTYTVHVTSVDAAGHAGPETGAPGVKTGAKVPPFPAAAR